VPIWQTVEAAHAESAAKQTALEQALADAPDWQEPDDARERARRYDHAAHLKLQLELLHVGRLQRGPRTTSCRRRNSRSASPS
jgi:hypothetical protein